MVKPLRVRANAVLTGSISAIFLLVWLAIWPFYVRVHRRSTGGRGWRVRPA